MLLRRKLATVALLVLSVVGLLACEAREPLPVERDEAGVYEAVLREYAALVRRWAHPPEAEYFTIHDHAWWWADFYREDDAAPRDLGNLVEDAPWIRRALFALRADCLEDYAKQLWAPQPLPHIETDVAVRWLPQPTKADSDAMSWDDFWEQNPGSFGRMSLSRVGFDATGKQALVSITSSRGPLNSWSHYVLLERGRFGWYVVARFRYMVS